MSVSNTSSSRRERHMLVRLRDVFTQALTLSLATLREIFDETAYARFLARHQATSSRQAYSAFLREQAHAKSRRHRCC